MNIQSGKAIRNAHPADAPTLKLAALHLPGTGESAVSRRGFFALLLMVLAATLLSFAATPAEAAKDAGHGHAHHDNERDPDTGRLPTPEGMTIAIVKPEDGARFRSDEPIPVEVRTEGLSVSGDHWHLYVDGELQAMVGGGRTRYELRLPAAAPGEYTLEVTISNAAHEEYDLVSSRTIHISAPDPGGADATH